LFEGVRWFWDLTCDFWAENAKNKCKDKKQKKIPHSTSLRAGSAGMTTTRRAKLEIGVRGKGNSRSLRDDNQRAKTKTETDTPPTAKD
jgi:hypothetical protein